MYNLYITMNEKLDYAQICAWLKKASDLSALEGLAPGIDWGAAPKEKICPARGCWPDGVGELFAECGLAAASAGECEALAAIEGGRSAEDLLDEFRASQARRMYLFASRCMTKQSFAAAVLDVDANLLDKSILLPMGLVGDRSARRRMSLLVLDKERKGEQRVPVAFIDASRLGGDDLLDAPREEKNFWEVAMRRESIVASSHVPPPVAPAADGRRCRPLSELADVIRAPAFYKHPKSDKTVEAACLSPKNFEPFGYTRPIGEPMLYDESALREEMRLRPSDILVLGLRSVGKAAIIDPKFDLKFPFVATNSTYIVRCKPGVDPRALYMYVTATSTSAHLYNLAASSGTPVLRIGDLKGLPVPIVDDDTRAGMIEAFERLEAIRKEIFRLNGEAHGLKWKYFPLRRETEPTDRVFFFKPIVDEG